MKLQTQESHPAYCDDISMESSMGADHFSSEVDYTTLPEASKQGDDKSNKLQWDEEKDASLLHHKQGRIWVQVWGTPGKECDSIVEKTKAIYTAYFSDNFSKNANAAVLVYNAYSSTSFTHTLKRIQS
jgi:hypothetical protein